MSGFWEALAVLAVAVNPASLIATVSEGRADGRAPSSPGPYAAGWALALLCAFAAAVNAGELLQALDVPVESFRLTPGAVLLAEGLQGVWRGRSVGITLPRRAWEWSIHPIALPGLLGPATLASVLLLAAENEPGRWPTILAYGFVTAAAAAAAWAAQRPFPLWRSLAQLTGTLQVSLGVAFVVAGIHAI